MNYKKFKQYEDISGAGGGKGGGGGSSGAVEDANTLQSKAVVRVLEVISEGEIIGLSSGDGQSIFFDNTPVQNPDGTFNFSGVQFDTRVGLPSQAYMAGFPSAEAVTQISTTLTAQSPIVVQASNVDIDAVRITVQLPQGLSKQDTTNGNLHGSTIQLRIERRLDSNGMWLTVGEPTITGKTTSVYEIDYRVDRPAGAGLWSWRVTRLTPDATTATVHDATAIVRYTEIEDVKLEYDYTAYVGVSVDAQATGNTIPTRAYRVKGIICQVPSNYDAYSRTYTGQWNGTFKRSWTQNPAWVLYDLLTNERYGMGDLFGADQIDKFSFYQAAVYNDGLITVGGVQEPRFTFNGSIALQEDALKVLQAVASAQCAVLMYSGGVLWLNQDRPAAPVKLVTNANVIDGKFTRTSSALQQRHTVARVTWNDPDNKYAATIATVEAGSEYMSRYGYVPTDVGAFGCISESQAIRAGRWLLDTELNTTELISYQSSFEQFDLRVGDVIKVWDESYTATAGAGRIVSISGNNVTLDKAVTLAPSSTLSISLPDGTFANMPIVQTSGTTKVVTITGTFTETPQANANYIVTAAVAPQLFRIRSLSTDENIVNVTAVQYDEAKYARVESGYTVSQSPYSKVSLGAIAPVENITASQESYTDAVLGVVLGLRINWDKSTTAGVTSYEIKYSYNSGEYTAVTTTQNTYLIPNATAGTYKVVVYAIGAGGKRSRGTIASFDNSYSGSSALSAVSAVTIVSGYGNGTEFFGDHLYVQWDANTSNQYVSGSSVGGYLVEVFDATTGSLLRAESVGPSTTTYDYTYDKNTRDGGPHRHLRVDVYTLDAYQRPSVSHATGTFHNQPPAVPSNIMVTALTGSLMLSWDKPADTDYAGTLVWLGTAAGFTPSANNLKFDGDTSLLTLDGLDPSTTYRIRVAAYDTFGKNYDGSELNLSGEISATPNIDTGIPSVSTLPTTGIEGQFVYNTTDQKLYRWHNGAWGAAVTATSITGQLTDSQIADLNAAKLTSQIVATQIQDGAISTPKLAAGSVSTAKLAAGAVTAYTIAADTITGANIAAGAISAGELAAGSVIADKIAAGVIDASKIAASTISADKIAANAIGTAHLQASAVNASKIAANVINSSHLRTDTLVVTTSAQIASLTVDTLHIKGNAITVATVGNWTNSQIAEYGWATAYTYYAQAPQSVTVICEWNVNTVDYGTKYYDIYCDGGLIYRYGFDGPANVGSTAVINVSLGAGNHNFVFVCKEAGGYALNWAHASSFTHALILGALR